MSAGDFDRAISHLEALVQMGRADRSVARALGMAYVRERRFLEAVAILTSVPPIERVLPEVRAAEQRTVNVLASAYLGLGRDDEAVGVLRDAGRSESAIQDLLPRLRRAVGAR